MSEWKEYKLGDFTSLITKGTTPSTIGGSFTDTGINFIKSESLNYEGIIDVSKFVFIDEKSNQLLKRSILKEKDILFSIAGIYLGKIGVIEKQHLPSNTNQACAIIRLKHNKVDYKFIKQYFTEKSFIKYVNSLTGQAAQPNINLTDLGKLKLYLPPLPEQHRIASILSTYDELIENNIRRIAILEQTAEQIYKEWFVRMRFPGYENTEFEKGVPKGWEWKKVGEIFKTSSGGTPSRQKEQEYFGGNIDWIKTGELKDSYIFDSEEKITDAGLQNSSAKLFPPDSLLMAMYGVNIGQLGISVKPSTANQAVCVFSPKAPKEYSLYYSYFYFKSIRSHLFNISMGAAQQNLSQEIIKRLNFLKPEKNLLSSFNKIQKPIFELLLKLSLQDQNLKQTRDLLLPRLISGKLKVKEAEKEID